VHLLTLGCARNEVDSEELAGRLAAAGMTLVAEPSDAEAVIVNTCGFIESAKKDSVDTVLAAADLKTDGSTTQAVIAVGCLAQRYGRELAASLPEADAVLGFDDYPDIVDRVRSVLRGDHPQPPVPTDRRLLLPVTPVQRQRSASGPDTDQLPDRLGPTAMRTRLDNGPTAALKIASGCDRRCAFCAIPMFRGAFVSRPVAEVLAEARWLIDEGARELFLVSENTTSYGKDLGDLRSLEQLLEQLSMLDGLERVRVSYLQPAEMRDSLVEVMCTTDRVAPYFDLSFQHASRPVLRRMRRFGDAERFLALLHRIRCLSPDAGIRTNVIVGFPGEDDHDVAVLHEFLQAAEFDVVGVFGYSDEDGTEAVGLDGKVPEADIRDRVADTSRLVEHLVDERARDRYDQPVRVLVESLHSRGEIEGRADHQGPEVDGTTMIQGVFDASIGDVVTARVTGNVGADLTAEAQPRT